VSARRAGRTVHVAVCDRGPGVPARYLGKVFEAFYRGEDELTRRNQGTGLGLALVRGLVERMGGTVRAQNQAGGGFEVEIQIGLSNEE
jgi:two-component system sensor histidine kinase KdpD